MRISDWSSDVCLPISTPPSRPLAARRGQRRTDADEGRARAAVEPPAPAREPGCHPLGHRCQQQLVDELHRHEGAAEDRELKRTIGREACRERGCQSVSISVVHVPIQKTTYTYH